MSSTQQRFTLGSIIFRNFIDTYIRWYFVLVRLSVRNHFQQSSWAFSQLAGGAWCARDTSLSAVCNDQVIWGLTDRRLKGHMSGTEVDVAKKL